MPSRNLGPRLLRKVKRLQNRKLVNTGTVILRWRELAAGAPMAVDPLIAVTAAAATFTERSEEKQAFIHYVTVNSTGYVRHAEVTRGDVILDFPGDIEIDGRDALDFEIDGVRYVQKTTGLDLAKSWDVRCGNTRVTRSILVTPKS